MLQSRIISVADVYDAITSTRPYNEPMLPSEAFEYIMSNSSFHFDPEIVKIFIRKIAPCPLGTMVRLNNGRLGIVAENHEDCTMCPKIKLIPDHASAQEEVQYLDLKNEITAMNVTITEVIL